MFLYIFFQYYSSQRQNLILQLTNSYMHRAGFSETRSHRVRLLTDCVRLLTNPPLQNSAKADLLRSCKPARMAY